MLADGMVDVELDPKHYETALNRSLAVFRQRSDNAVEESYVFLTLTESTNEYILPKEIQQVREIFRRSVGSRTGNGTGGTVFEPFNLAYTNTYLLSSTNMGGLLTYELFAQYQELVGKMFGSFINFTWHPQSHKLIIHQRPRGEESVMLQVYNSRPDFVIIDDVYSGQWIKDYTATLRFYRRSLSGLALPYLMRSSGRTFLHRLTIARSKARKSYAMKLHG